jgi:hypothetical protein
MPFNSNITLKGLLTLSPSFRLAKLTEGLFNTPSSLGYEKTFKERRRVNTPTNK